MSDLKRTAIKISEASGLTLTQLGLRFDKVAVRVLESLEAWAHASVPNGSVLIVTITAPIREASKTTRELETHLAKYLARKTRRRIKTVTINKNEISFLITKSKVKRGPKMIGFVHNPSTDARMLIELSLGLQSR